MKQVWYVLGADIDSPMPVLFETKLAAEMYARQVAARRGAGFWPHTAAIRLTWSVCRTGNAFGCRDYETR